MPTTTGSTASAKLAGSCCRFNNNGQRGADGEEKEKKRERKRKKKKETNEQLS